MTFGSVDQAIADIKAGKLVIVADDEDRENEGDLICAAQLVTADLINFMIRQAGGLICLALAPERVEQLDLAPMSETNPDEYRTAYTVSIDAVPRFGVTTGISAQDRATTIRVAVDPGQFAVRSPARRARVPAARARGRRAAARGAHRGGHRSGAARRPLSRRGHLRDPERGRQRRPPRQLEKFAEQHGLTFITVAQLVAHRLKNERLVHRVAEARLPTEFGTWQIVGYRNDVDPHEHVALVYGDVADGESVLVRMHSKCLTGDVFHSKRCDCGWQLDTAMQMIAAEGRGVIVYLDQEGRGIGLLNKLKAYELQDTGVDTVEANERLGFKPDLRNYGIGAQILLDLGLKSIRPITNNPRKMVGLEGYGLRIEERVPIVQPAQEENAGYMKTKREKLGHLLVS